MPTLKRRWTVADLEDLPEDGNRYEIIDGELFVTPAPSFRHQAAVGELHRVLSDYLTRERVGYAFVAPADIVFSEKRAVQPDVFAVPLVNGRRPEHFDEVKRLLLPQRRCRRARRAPTASPSGPSFVTRMSRSTGSWI
ncbi:MAG TPA: Uma2 family endonuclease [Gemmatimonadaceae bacterium]